MGGACSAETALCPKNQQGNYVIVLPKECVLGKEPVGHGRERRDGDVQQVTVALLPVLRAVGADDRVPRQPNGPLRAGHRQSEHLAGAPHRRSKVLRQSDVGS